MYSTFKSRVTEAEQVSSPLKRIKLELVDPKEMDFRSGQFVSLFLPENKGMRSYSISNCDDKKNFIELTANVMDNRMGGAGSEYISSLKVGDEVMFRGPFGIFNLENTKAFEYEGEIIWIATGAGIAPIKGMIECFNNHKNNTNKLYFGIRNESEMCYRDFLEETASKHPNFSFEYILSQPEQNWTGKSGYVTKYIVEDFSDTTKKSKAKVYICGRTATVQSIFATLKEDGFNDQNIHFENFG